MLIGMNLGAAQTSVLKQDVVTVAWVTRPPFQYLDHKTPKGSRLERVKLVFKLANIPIEFIEAPAKRIWSQFTDQNGSSNYCSFDWYKLPEREALVQFSIPLEFTPPYSILSSPSSYAQVAAHTNLESLLGDTSLSLGLLDAVSYGKELTAMIKKSGNKITHTTTSPSIMARMISANRASYMFIDKREWEFLKKNDPSLNALKLLEMEGTPLGQPSYLVCGKKMDAARMQRINQAIEYLLLNH
jgi:uncharacterized protein (TIGR02285 family)